MPPPEYSIPQGWNAEVTNEYIFIDTVFLMGLLLLLTSMVSCIYIIVNVTIVHHEVWSKVCKIGCCVRGTRPTRGTRGSFRQRATSLPMELPFPMGRPSLITLIFLLPKPASIQGPLLFLAKESEEFRIKDHKFNRM